MPTVTASPTGAWEWELRQALHGIASTQYTVRMESARRAAYAIQMAGHTPYVKRIIGELKDAARYDDAGAQLVLNMLGTAVAA